ncbi:MAG: class I SAM-dependent methyltransferase [Bdellovibrionaceae bacterium]|nr:class I SAM-dependent methyltransferase [Pseudobdellovibrionaceae bacterium]
MNVKEVLLDQNAEESSLLSEFLNKYSDAYSFHRVPFSGQEQLFLTCQNDRVGLIKGKQKICCVDWTEETLLKRFAQTSTKEIFIQAVTNKKSSTVLYDLTAGMGKDCFIASKFFERVVLVERNPIVHLLLQDGLRRALKHDKAARFARKILLHCMDAEVALHSIQQATPNFPWPDVIYFDFMFENKKSQSTKSMEILRELESMDGDANIKNGELISRALNLNPAPKVVLKAKKLPDDTEVSPKKTYTGKVVDYHVF